MAHFQYIVFYSLLVRYLLVIFRRNRLILGIWFFGGSDSFLPHGCLNPNGSLAGLASFWVT